MFNRRISTRSLLIFLLFVALSSEHRQAFAQSQTDIENQRTYTNAIYDASVYKFSNLRPLKPLKFDPVTHTARVVTLTSFGYELGRTKPLQVDVWVTAVPEVQQACQAFTGDLALRLKQFLGLPPNQQFTNFVMLTVKEGDIFRPTTNPDPTTTLPCGCPVEPNCGESFPKDVSPAHIAWIANQMLASYSITESREVRS